MKTTLCDDGSCTCPNVPSPPHKAWAPTIAPLTWTFSDRPFPSSVSMFVTRDCMCEFVFYNDGGSGRWLATLLNVAAAKKP